MHIHCTCIPYYSIEHFISMFYQVALDFAKSYFQIYIFFFIKYTNIKENIEHYIHLLVCTYIYILHFPSIVEVCTCMAFTQNAVSNILCTCIFIQHLSLLDQFDILLFAFIVVDIVNVVINPIKSIQRVQQFIWRGI